MTKDEALRLALKTLEYAGPSWIEARQPAITAIKAALEAKDEPWEQFYPEMGKPKFMEVQDGGCKHCTDGCPACDARKLPEQEPVAWAKFSAKGNIIDLLSEPDDDYTPLYTTPPQRTWVGLTDEEIWETISRIGTSDSDVNPYAKLADARAIEAKLKEKNT